jgi:hypothetical protein
MPGTVIGTQMNLGYPGQFARNADCIIAARLVASADASGPNFGSGVILNSDNSVSDVAVAVAANKTVSMATFVGIAAREIKSFTTYNPAPTIGNYQPGQTCDHIERGSVSVQCLVGQPTPGGKVYLRTALNGAIPAGIVGGFEANTDGGNSFQLTNAFWTTGQMDSNNVAELTLVNRNLP